MLFIFLKYLQPTHYFQIFKKDGFSVFPKIKYLPKEIVEQLELDTRFTSDIGMEYELSWQAIHKGYIGKSETYSSFEKVPIEDEYRFIRKYFHKVWVFYVLCLRLMAFNNPVKELKAWIQSRNVKQISFSQALKYDTWEECTSTLILQKPLVSVVIPTLNRYDYLKDVLSDLEQQEYKNFEVLVVDQSEPFQPAFYTAFDLKLQLIRQEEKALWLARNTAIKIAKGEYILLFDDDSRVAPDWILSHVKCLDYFQSDLSSGVSISEVGAKTPANYNFFRVSDQLDTGNVLIRKSVFKKLGLFDRQFEKQRMGDGEFGLRAYLEGYLNISNPYAKRLHLKVGTGGLREMGSWDAFRSQNWLDPRPIPSVLYFHRKYFGNYNSRLGLLKTIPTSIMPYRFKGHRMYTILGAILFLFFMPVVLFQVNKSWRLASDKLSCGPLIETID
ncbi:glycosyltransferase family 2 protein [Xanthomarina sp.]|uniref:glycosyltransferase family 2 protein n=1 Tax=Xanthomarina sp. TaxID=1931211 RepID=UPI002BA1526A|nr:glycosyltransferase [Xanthomarina sp.]HLV40393.1 glycosyltransferase [Xanthomarina sp.]